MEMEDAHNSLHQPPAALRRRSPTPAVIRRVHVAYRKRGTIMEFFPGSWIEVFAIETALFELIVRGTILYFSIIVFMRLLPRIGGELAVMDLVFLLLIAEAAAHGMGEHKTVGDAIVLVATLMAWNYLLNLLSFHIPFIERLISGSPVQIVRDGRLMRRNMRREYLTEDELMAQLRRQGIENIEDVKAAYIEGEGQLTVISRKPAEQ
jgi:uncharacterized membrane protein YcaP (DUF421 family)